MDNKYFKIVINTEYFALVKCVNINILIITIHMVFIAISPINLPWVRTLEFLVGFFLIPKVKELCAKADKLMISHSADAPQIQQMKLDLVSNWERIRALATNRYAKLKASYGSEHVHIVLSLSRVLNTE